MYSITQSPTLAIDLAHAVIDEHLRRAAATGRGSEPARPRRRRKHLGWPVRPWTGRPAAAF